MITTLFERDVFPDQPGPWSRAGESRVDRVRSPLPLAHRAKRAPATVDRSWGALVDGRVASVELIDDSDTPG